ncbi:alpha-ketoglutarate-dependent dioxygenase AlkB [Pusillimonas sp. T2]|uniref:DNA oxidative demethylase AlkB n=1 Tax=Pusillimonas sp. T2 TaxID=1548123 RepID=UPI000B8E7C32|nr:DNA oxidative demethylase AlkB [Pusillimonas sp. T2]OXR50252.1 alpha-ketoglutarate-dependent dioxygenase AlkB [Pusillimonas sp. T2]
MQQLNLLGGIRTQGASSEQIGPQAFIFRGFLLDDAAQFLVDLNGVLQVSPWRRMPTARGWMSVDQSNCGPYGWISDKTGYRYSSTDPLSGQPWPDMPELWQQRAFEAAEAAGFKCFEPQACLLNRYRPKSKMGLHQDRDEEDLAAPIVSVSLGLPAVFLFGGLRRTDPVEKYLLEHGDVLVWGGADRMRFHGVMPVRQENHELLGEQRLNLTFRRVQRR